MGGPDFLSIEAPSFAVALRAGAYACEVGAGIWLAHADAKKSFSAGDRGKMALLLGLGAIFENEGPALAVRDPVSRDGSTEIEQFLYNNEAGKRAALRAPVFAWECDPEVAALAQLAAEIGIESSPRARSLFARHAAGRFPKELTKPFAQGFILRGDGGRIQ